MSRLKATALILSIAVFNPLCCCLQLFASPAEAAPAAPAADAHGCCTADSMPGEAKDAAHAQDVCPHSFEKESLITHAADAPELNAKLLGNAFELPETRPLLSELPRSLVREYRAPAAAPAACASVAQAYCVRLL